MDKLCECVKTAYHEAGHAVAVVMQSVEAVRASIRANDTARGHVAYNLNLLCDDQAVNILRAEQAIIIALAGGMAEKLHNHENPTEGAGRDMVNVARLLYAIDHNDANPDPHAAIDYLAEAPALVRLDRLAAKTEALLLRHWYRVKLIAEALLARETLDGAALRTLARSDTVTEYRAIARWGACEACRRKLTRPRRTRKAEDPTVEQLTLF